jgi:rod shape determining protein RodA
MLTSLRTTDEAPLRAPLRLWQKLGRIDWGLFVLMLSLCCLSVVVVYSATFANESAEFRNAYLLQSRWLAIGLVGFFVMAFTDYRFWVKNALVIMGVTLALLVLVLVIGQTIFGAQSWIRLGPIGLQPSELSKIAFVIFLTWFFAQVENRGFIVFAAVIALTLIPVGLILQQPDLGSAAVFLPTAYAMMFTAGVRKRYLLMPILLGILLIGYVFWCLYPAPDSGRKVDVPFLKEYQENRILTFVDPNRDPQNAGWTINQSLIAIGSGGLQGKGFLQGTTSMLGFLPRNVASNDFIFPVYCEQWGFVGGALLIMALGGMLLWIIRIGAAATDNTGTLITVGIVGILFTHIFINIGMTIKVVPITGIPLPFISYGGTFLVVCLAALGLVQSVWIHRKN